MAAAPHLVYPRLMYSGSVAVIGGGAWGLALSAAATRTGTAAFIHSRRPLKDHLPKGVEQLTELADVAKRARVIVLATPSEVAREVAKRLGDVVDGRHLLVHGVRGLEGEALTAISQVLREETPARRVGALGGPVLSEDLLAGKPSVLVCGSHFPEVNEAITRAFGSATLRVYATSDLTGLEWASALVGCLAIGVGYAQELGINAGLVAALISRGVEEAGRVAAAAGGQERTLLGLAGYGDLLASISQSERPEVLVGAALARGKTVEEAVKVAKLRVEAVDLLPRIASWIEERGVTAPIFRALAGSLLTSSRSPEAIIHELMTSPIQKLA